jgi:pyruvate dehydrogenase (quinone)
VATLETQAGGYRLFSSHESPPAVPRRLPLYETVSSPAQAPAVIHQAIAEAYAGRGVAHLTLPVDVLMAKIDGSDRLKAPLIHSVKGKDIMPYDDPRWMGGIGMIGTKADYHAVIRS